MSYDYKFLLYMRQGDRGAVVINECRTTKQIEEIIRDRVLYQPRAEHQKQGTEKEFDVDYLDDAPVINAAIRRIHNERHYLGDVCGWRIVCFETGSTIHLLYSSDFIEQVRQHAKTVPPFDVAR